MLWVPKKGVLRKESNLGTVGASKPGTSVTTGAAASTKGTTTQLIASTSFDAYYVRVIANNYGLSATASQGSMDILIGAATEDLLIPDLLMGYCGGDVTATMAGWKVWEFPLYIPAGSRLSAAAAGARTTAAFAVGIELIGGDGYPPFRVGSKVTTYGMGTVPDGTAITPGVSGAAGTFTQITASTTSDHFAFVPSFQATGVTTMTSKSFCVAIGVGAATEEEIGSWWFGSQVVEEMYGPMNATPAFQDVPSGTRLAMRASNHGTNDTAYNGCIHAVSA